MISKNVPTNALFYTTSYNVVNMPTDLILVSTAKKSKDIMVT